VSIVVITRKPSLLQESVLRAQALENRYGRDQNDAYTHAYDHTSNIVERYGSKISGFLVLSLGWMFLP